MHYPQFHLESSIKKLKQLDQQERRINLQIIDELYEIEKRKAYADLKYDGLYSFCVKELSYTESQSYQRIQAMRAIKTMPELKERIQNGNMNITTVAQVHTYLRQEQVQTGNKKTKEEKLVLFQSFENKTSRQVKEEILQLRGERIKKKLIIELDEEAEILWEQAKAKLAHQTQGDDLNCLKVLLKNLPKDESYAKQIQIKNGPLTLNQNLQRTSSWSKKQTRYIPKQVKIEVKAKAEHKCHNCGSQYALQIEHKQPFALNGSQESQNLELLCRNCNLNRGINTFGLQKMKRT